MLDENAVVDYGRSFVTFVTENRRNNARLQTEAICILTDKGTGSQTRTSSSPLVNRNTRSLPKTCSSRRTTISAGSFRTRSMPSTGPTRHTPTGFGRRACGEDRFVDIRFDLVVVPAQRLTKNDEIVRASLSCVPLVGRVELEGEVLSAVLELPVKTMNANDIENIYQVDTGPSGRVIRARHRTFLTGLCRLQRSRLR